MASSTTRTLLGTSELVEPLIRFEGAPAEFLNRLVEAQCRVAGAEAGAIMRAGREGVELIAVYPEVDADRPPVWLAQAMELCAGVLSAERSRVVPLRTPEEFYGAEPDRHLAMLPMRAGTDVRGAAAFVLNRQNEAQREESVARLELTASLLALYEMRLTLSARAASLNWLKQACGVLWEVNTHGRFRAAGMALCNQVASVWDAERVSLGLVRGRYVKMQAQSHTEKFTRKTELVQAIEAAMEECFDQDAEVLAPAPPESPTINRAAVELSKRFGPCTVLSLPLRHEDKVVGVLAVERAADRGFDLEEVEALRLACNLVTPRLVEMGERDRWLGVRMAAEARRGVGWFVGPTHTWIKALAVVVFGLIAYATFVTGTYRIDAPFVVEANTRHVIAAPFDGFLEASDVKIGAEVVAGRTVLAELDTSRLKLERASLRAQIVARQAEANLAKQQGKTAEEAIAYAQADELAARVALIDDQIAQAKIVSPIDGVIVAGDLTKRVDSPIKVGETLFEIARLDDLRARLAVPEATIADVRPEQIGQLAAVSHPDQYMDFTVERIDPVAEVVNQRNIFAVRATLGESRPWLRPGMEGLAKIDAGEARMGWIWTRELVNWVRMKLWI